MRKLEVVPYGWPCPLMECPPGLFVYGDQLCFKSEYGDNDGKMDVYNSAGEYFHGPKDINPNVVIVQPVISQWCDTDF